MLLLELFPQQVKGVHTSRGSTGLPNPFLREDVDPGVRNDDIRFPPVDTPFLGCPLGEAFELDGVEPSICNDCSIGRINNRAAERGVSDVGKRGELLDFGGVDFVDELLADDVHVSSDPLEVGGMGTLYVVDGVSDGHFE
jgi:hypothetical protein